MARLCSHIYGLLPMIAILLFAIPPKKSSQASLFIPGPHLGLDGSSTDAAAAAVS